MVAGVEMPVESDRPARAGGAPSLHVRLLGPLTISREGVALALPASRKVRALIAYLSLAPHAVTRSQLCELLWDVPNDPRGELRWCLSKVRSIVDEPGRRRVDARGDTIRLDLSGLLRRCDRDRPGDPGGHRDAALRSGCATLSALFAGDFLDGLEIDRSPVFNGWLTAQRRRFRGCHAALLEHLVASVSDDEVFGYLEKWLAACAVRPARPRDPAERARAARPHSRGRGASGGDGPAVRGRGSRLRAAFATCGGRRGRRQTLRRASQRRRPRRGARSEQRPCRARHGCSARRASIAVMPFVDRAAATGVRGGPADGLAHDVITRLAKLRSLFVIAQGTVFALHERRIGAGRGRPDAERRLRRQRIAAAAAASASP